ncbi:MAG: hypothetical protein J1G04_00255 [Clostridiales bacterium]|nr:hypothetical protein [Clostridiales bacterium]
MTNPIEQQQVRLMTLMTNYKVANNQCKMLPKISKSLIVAILSFVAAVLSLIFGCLCFSKNKLFNYIITGIIILLFIAILLLQLMDYFHCCEKRLNKRLEQEEKRMTVKYRCEVIKRRVRRLRIRKELIQQLSESQKNNERAVTYEVMTEEELLDEYVKEHGIEESITVYEKHLEVLNQLNAALEKRDKLTKCVLWILSAVAFVVSIVYISINNIH